MGQPIPKTAVIQAVTDQVSCAVGEETVILQLKSGTYFGLNEVGTRVWNLVQEPRSLSEVERTILSEYDVDAGRCEKDLQELIGSLQEKALIEIKA